MFLSNILVTLIAGFVLSFAQTTTTLAGHATTIGSSGAANGIGTSASFDVPAGVAFNSPGTLFVVDSGNNKIRAISPAGVVTTFAGSGVIGFANGVGLAASFYYPYDVAVSVTTGTIYVSDTGNNAIRAISPSGAVTTFAGGAVGVINGVGTNAKFDGVAGLAMNPPTAFNYASILLYAADSSNNQIRLVSPTGAVSVLSGSTRMIGFLDGPLSVAMFNFPSDIAVDATGTVFVADSGNNRIRSVAPTGSVTTFAGSGSSALSNGVGTLAAFNFPEFLAFDTLGILFVADANNNAIRRITPASVVTTYAGQQAAGRVEGTGTNAKFSSPSGLAFSSAGTLLVSDTSNNCIRAIGPAPSTSKTPTPSRTRSPTRTPSPIAIPSGSNTVTPSFAASSSVTFTPLTGPVSVTVTLDASPSMTSSFLTMPSVTASPTSTIVESLTAMSSSTGSVTSTSSQTTFQTPSGSDSGSTTASLSSTITTSSTSTFSLGGTASSTSSASQSATIMASLSATQTPSTSPSNGGGSGISVTPTLSSSVIGTSTPSIDPTSSITSSSTPSPTATISNGASPSVTPTLSSSVTGSDTNSLSGTLTSSSTQSGTPTSAAAAGTLTPLNAPASVTGTVTPVLGDKGALSSVSGATPPAVVVGASVAGGLVFLVLIIIALMFFVRRIRNIKPLSSSAAPLKNHELNSSVCTTDNPLAAAVPEPLSPPLRVWRRTSDDDDVWFVHIVTGESAWSAPDDQILDDDKEIPLPSAPTLRIWQRVSDGTDSWLVNSVTGESAWEGTVNAEEIMIELK